MRLYGKDSSIAFLMRCSHCERPEISHRIKALVGIIIEMNNVIHSYEVSLTTCPGYEPVDKKLHESMKKDRNQAMIETHYGRNVDGPLW
jgi:hypothetical protein